MNEFKTAKEIVSAVNALATGTVERVELEVGELSQVNAMHIVERLKKLAAWHVRAVQCPGKVHCPNCQFEGRPKMLDRHRDELAFTCPECLHKPDIVYGNGIKIKKIEYKKTG